jgi:hypothetical protein
MSEEESKDVDMVDAGEAAAEAAGAEVHTFG